MQAHCRSDTRLMVSRLAGQLREDCRLLEELRVMDYSLLLGIHFRSPDYGSTPQATDKVSMPSRLHVQRSLGCPAASRLHNNVAQGMPGT